MLVQIKAAQVNNLAEVMKDLSYCLKLLVHKLIVVLSSYWQGHKVSTAIAPNIYCLKRWILCRHCLVSLPCTFPACQPVQGMDQGCRKGYLLKAG